MPTTLGTGSVEGLPAAQGLNSKTNRTVPLPIRNECHDLLIWSYSLLRNLCHIRVLEDCFHDVSMLSGNEKSNIGQSDRSNRLPGRFSFVRCEKHSDVFRTRQKSRRELQQLVQNTISVGCSHSFPVGRMFEWHRGYGLSAVCFYRQVKSIKRKFM